MSLASSMLRGSAMISPNALPTSLRNSHTAGRRSFFSSSSQFLNDEPSFSCCLPQLAHSPVTSLIAVSHQSVKLLDAVNSDENRLNRLETMPPTVCRVVF